MAEHSSSEMDYAPFDPYSVVSARVEGNQVIEAWAMAWSPALGEIGAIPAFVDRRSGLCYEMVGSDQAHVCSYLMDYNMYEKECWSCNQPIEVPKHHSRCFFCASCCLVKKHPNGHV